MIKLLKRNFLFIFAVIILGALLFRNPYSTRTLIPNLEPFPDAQYYTTTPRCFLNGQSWKMCRLYDQNIKGIKSAVPPAYSLTFLPAYLANPDVRSFYFVNLILAFTSLLLLYKVSQNFFKNQLITGVVLLLYVTNYFIYWYPTLAMAENLILPLFLASILLFQKPVSKKNSFLAGLLASSFYATKYAFAPLTAVLPILYLLKILFEKKPNKEKIFQILLLLVPAGLILANLLGIEQIANVFNEVSNGAINTNSSAKVTSGGGYFSISYFYKHIIEYSYALLGKSQKFLWDSTPLVAKWIALPALLGLLASFKNKKYNFAKTWLVASIVFQLLFISTFYVVDIRYVYHFLPILLLGFGFFLQLLNKTLLKRGINFISFITMILIIYLGSNAVRLKSVIMINIKYSETPWWYLSQVEMNNYFNNLPETSARPFLITLASPFLTDNYSNQKYKVLPLDDQQDFRGTMNEVWGSNNYENLIRLYKKELLDNKKVYITNYGVSAAGHFKQSYKEIEDNFNLTKMQSGCHNLCNIYELSIP